MKLSICKNIKLDGDYTNHSIRATVIETLDNAGFEARHIIKLTSHKSELTVKEYARKCPENKRKAMFQSLSKAMDTTPKRQRSIPSEAPSKPPEINNIVNDLPNFELNALEDLDTIDDKILQEIMIEFEANSNKQNSENKNPNVVAPLVPTCNTQVNQQQIDTQINTINQMPLQRMPAMYFPNSNVTINYNFGK